MAGSPVPEQLPSGTATSFRLAPRRLLEAVLRVAELPLPALNAVCDCRACRSSSLGEYEPGFLSGGLPCRTMCWLVRSRCPKGLAASPSATGGFGASAVRIEGRGESPSRTVCDGQARRTRRVCSSRRTGATGRPGSPRRLAFPCLASLGSFALLGAVRQQEPSRLRRLMCASRVRSSDRRQPAPTHGGSN
jgi:hypothetical protein